MDPHLKKRRFNPGLCIINLTLIRMMTARDNKNADDEEEGSERNWKHAEGYSSTNASALLSMSSTEAKSIPADAFTSSSARHGTVGDTASVSRASGHLPPAPEPLVKTTSPFLLMDCNTCVSRGAQ